MFPQALNLALAELSKVRYQTAFNGAVSVLFDFCSTSSRKAAQEALGAAAHMSLVERAIHSRHDHREPLRDPHRSLK